ncbi:MAG: type II toxin-antitoxin system VapC family toxin [Prolixibacteraceae bacterium]|nr:type II toxin-antitoxin system VapC family toxin [Prolixibacteraceae bacterium]
MEAEVRYLVDTNVWLERLLDQDKSNIVKRFFDIISPESIYVSDFAMHSIGVILSRLNKLDVLSRFIEDLFSNGRIEQLSLDAKELLDVVNNMGKFKLDFDDAYQFTVALKYGLTIVTFDKDFDLRGVKKQSPDDIIKT